MSLLHHLRPMDLRDILDETFDLYKENFLPLFKAAAIIFVPLQLFLSLIGSPSFIEEVMSPGSGEPNMTALFGSIFWFVAYYIAIGALTFIISELYLGRSISIGEAYREVFRRSGSLLRSLVVASLAVGGMGIAVIILIALVAMLLVAINLILLWVGLVILIPVTVAVVLAMMFLVSFVVPVVILEGLTGGAAVKRSWDLFFFNPVKAFFALLLIVILFWILFGILLLPAGLVTGLATADDPGRWVGVLLGGYEGLVNAVLQPLDILVILLVYYDVRIRKEGFDLEMMASELRGEATGSDAPMGQIEPAPEPPGGVSDDGSHEEDRPSA